MTAIKDTEKGQDRSTRNSDATFHKILLKPLNERHASALMQKTSLKKQSKYIAKEAPRPT
jgi:hypothetical protein